MKVQVLVKQTPSIVRFSCEVQLWGYNGLYLVLALNLFPSAIELAFSFNLFVFLQKNTSEMSMHVSDYNPFCCEILIK